MFGKALLATFIYHSVRERADQRVVGNMPDDAGINPCFTQIEEPDRDTSLSLQNSCDTEGPTWTSG